MKKWIFPLLLIVAFVIGACAPAAAPAPAESESAGGGEAAAPAVTSERCGDPSKLDKEVSFYNWTDYIDEEIINMFQEECGVKIIYDTYSSNEDLLAKMQAGATGYDLIVPSDYMVSIMRQLDLLKELDQNNIPNIANINPLFTEAPYDPGNVYSVPYQWGTTGIGFDLDQLGAEPTSWAAIFDPKEAEAYKGKISLLNDSRETIGAVLKYLGYSLNSTDPAQLEEAKQVLLTIKPYIAAFDSDSFDDLLVSGDTVIAHGWNGEFFKAMDENPDRNLGYIIPEEGGVIWTDTMAIPKTAPHPYTAEVLINYLLDPEIGAMLTNYNFYGSPNDASTPYILDEIKEDPGIYPSDETLARMEFIADLGETTLEYDRIWTEVKSQ